MQQRDERVIDEVESLGAEHNWNVDTASGELPLTLTSPDGETEISVHRSPITERSFLVAKHMEKQNKLRNKYGAVIVERVRFWLENH
jgi:hypothetical protein